MRFILLFSTLFFGIHLGANALATMSEYQERQANQFCQINTNYCK